MPTVVEVQLAFVGRSLRHSVRKIDALIMGIALPVILMLLFVYVFGETLTRRWSATSVVPQVILLCAGFGAAGTAVGVADDMTSGIVDRFRTMPINSAAVIGGHVVASLVRNLVATAVVITVALAVGFRPHAGIVEWLAALGLVSLWILAITWLFAALGVAAKSAEAADGYGFALMFLPYLSSALACPAQTMPSGLRWIAEPSADHPDHRDDPRPAVGHRLRPAPAPVGGRLVSAHHGRRDHLDRLAVPNGKQVAARELVVAPGSSSRVLRRPGGCLARPTRE